MLNTNISIDSVKFLKEIANSMAISVNYAYPGDVFVENNAHVALSCVSSKIKALEIFLDSLVETSK